MEKLLMLMLCQVLFQMYGVSSETINTDMWNSSDTNKDMFVINAMVYQVGIITNTTDHVFNNATGNQETLTIYHNNGSHVDLSQIPAPLLTNVTAQSLVAVAPVISSQDNVLHNGIGWKPSNHLAKVSSAQHLEQRLPTTPSSKEFKGKLPSLTTENNTDISLDKFYKRLYKRKTSNSSIPVALRKGSVIIPPAVGVQSIAIPPLLTLNNNMAKIPVPIPNASVIQYAKINTLSSKQ